MLKQESVEGEQKKWQNVKEKEIDQERRQKKNTCIHIII